MKRDQVIAALVEVARKAYFLADGTCDEGGIKTVDNDEFEELSVALDALDDLPEPGVLLYGTGPAKAEAMLAKSECVDCEDFLGEICRCADCHHAELCGNCNGVVDNCNPDSDDIMCHNKKLHRGLEP